MEDFFEDLKNQPRPNFFRRIYLWWEHDGKYYHKYFIQGVKNIAYWFPVIWKDRDWDGHYIYEVMKHKLRTCMNGILKKFFSLLLITTFSLVFNNTATAQDTTVNSKLRISVLTCDAGDDLYTIWGHTAVRVVDSINNTDFVFNFGIVLLFIVLLSISVLAISDCPE
jgi:hypothetical protein